MSSHPKFHSAHTQAVVVRSLISGTSKAEHEHRDTRTCMHSRGRTARLRLHPVRSASPNACICRSVAAAPGPPRPSARVWHDSRDLAVLLFGSPARGAVASPRLAAHHALITSYIQKRDVCYHAQQGPLRHKHKRTGRRRPATRVHHRCAHHTHHIVNWKRK